MEAVVVPASLIEEALDDLYDGLKISLCKIGDIVNGDLCQSTDCSLCVQGSIALEIDNAVAIDSVTYDDVDVTSTLASCFIDFAKRFVVERLEIERMKEYERLIDDLLETGRCRIVTNDIGDNELWKKL